MHSWPGRQRVDKYLLFKKNLPSKVKGEKQETCEDINNRHYRIPTGIFNLSFFPESWKCGYLLEDFMSEDMTGSLTDESTTVTSSLMIRVLSI